MKLDLADQVQSILAAYDPAMSAPTADALRELWLQFEPKSIAGIKAEQREMQETAGTPVPVLKAIGDQIARPARKRVSDFIPLCRLLWEGYGREGRAIAVIPLGAMELANAETIMPLVMELCRTCVTWEDADRLAMAALEPIIRKKPDEWLSALDPWLTDGNKWVRRAGVTVAGRLPMKRPEYTSRCLEMAECLLGDGEDDVRKAVSFAIRLCARGDVAPVREFLGRHVPPADPAATWVLCDAIRSMAKAFLPEFGSLLPRYQAWAGQPALSARDRRSIESAIKTLQKVED